MVVSRNHHFTSPSVEKIIMISDRRILANNDYKTISMAAAAVSSWEINRLNQSNTKIRNIIPTMKEIDYWNRNQREWYKIVLWWKLQNYFNHEREIDYSKRKWCIVLPLSRWWCDRSLWWMNMSDVLWQMAGLVPQPRGWSELCVLHFPLWGVLHAASFTHHFILSRPQQAHYLLRFLPFLHTGK